MPYIKKDDRFKFFLSISNADIQTAGEFNYVITMLAKSYINRLGKNYQHYNDIIGALEGCKLELYRRSIAPYEDVKIEENGDV